MSAIVLALLLLAGDESGRYPRDISPPPGTQYPCALTALPAGLPGIAAADREYINRTYARILRATQAKLLVLKALEDRRNIKAATNRYDEAIAKLLTALRTEAPPAGLQNFHRDVIRSMELGTGSVVAPDRRVERDGRALSGLAGEDERQHLPPPLRARSILTRASAPETPARPPRLRARARC